MQTMTQGYRSLSLIVRLNLDRMLYVATIVAALGGGAWLGSLFN
ncbi:hypothetical protein [Vannielia litorea]|uniref:Uncharacterized protein n=1 Tax=Vannielia litorea TaxID=1217970 RepID=A0A1N6F6G2_9RHOB|nr:hypothetical protein [Vannielia litorea]SIN90851.1 hypothetical protein SAMN05444002_1415 [Vannielia litorea]